MKKYQIVEIRDGDVRHAGSKAVSDVVTILEGERLQPLYIKTRRDNHGLKAKIVNQLGFYQDWKVAYETIEEGSILFLQHPFHHRQIGREKFLKQLKEKKNIKIISLVHDVEELRNNGITNDKRHQEEFDFMLSIADQFIVHNPVMKEFFLSKGIAEDQLICLGIFDYSTEQTINPPRFSTSLIFAGNFAPPKSLFSSKLGELIKLKFELYGPNYDNSHLTNNVVYHGSFPPDELPTQLNSGFGLVWDGDSLDECNGPWGNYLRYNNPHKLSLYLASGIPVVVWKSSALAGFVKDRQIGLTVDSLRDLEDLFATITETSYKTMSQNVANLSKELRSGTFTKQAFKQAVKNLENE
ncbi:putative glycosyl transferase [Streptococcus criceti]|uniref:Galactofuranosyltransferase n=1 Tax=Streptococcus criceti HS-6 TaxID=873449 RepID=G5JNG2_STRCG|nr:sugar transferase [Streptococcus criceti]EHI74498.1 hypothetical protein STRCR_1417 [Streptococcus criceti HS-6]SUN43341.1 putative glycosyl transferase [Streptococcus criceti]